MGQDGAGAQQTVPVEALQRARAGQAAALGVVHGVLRAVDVRAAAEGVAQLRHGGQGVVGQGEGGVSAGEAREEAVGVVGTRAQEARGLLQPRVAPRVAVAVGHLVAEHAARSDEPQRVAHAVEASRDGARRRVVVDDRGDAAQRGTGRARERAHEDRLVVERLVEFPPDKLEDLAEVGRGASRRGHSGGQRGVEVRVPEDEAGHQDAPLAVEDLRA